MNKKNLFIIIIATFLCSGCSVDYNIDIDKQLDFVENINLKATSDSDSQQIKEFNSFVPVNVDSDEASVFEKKFEDIEYYDIKKADNNNKLTFKFVSNMNKFSNDMFARSCYKYVVLTEKKDEKSKKRELLLSTSRQFLCFDNYDNLDDVTITIKSKYKLVETNADVQEKHKYTWYITKDNANDKFIYLLLDLKTRELSLWERIQEGEYVNMFTISLVLFLVGLVVWFLFKKKGDIKNKV